MGFTPRLKQILIILLEEKEPIQIKKLAEKLGVSKRTVQRELEFMESSIKKYAIRFYSKAGTGVWLEGTAAEKDRLLQDLKENDEPGIIAKEERRNRLILELLKDKTPKKLFYFSSLLDVSEATVSNDLDAVETWFAQYGLRISRKQGYGVVMEGEEKNFRRALRAFFEENLNSSLIRELYEKQEIERVSENKDRGIYNLLDDDILKRVIHCILGVRDEKIRSLTENSFMGLVLHVTIAINRILKSEIMEQDQAFIASLKKTEAFHTAEIVTRELEEEFEIQIPEIETAYICLHIEASKRQYVESAKDSQKQQFNRELHELVNDMIDAYDSRLAYYLKQDEEFVTALLAHLQPTIIRLRNGMTIGNPLLEDIKKDYPEIYEKCQRVRRVLESYLKLEVQETEVGFLAIHFGAATVRLENEKECRRTVQLGIVCASGIGISRLMQTKIARTLKDRVEISTFGKEEVTPYIAEKMDFFVSSLPLSMEQADVVYVNLLLPDSDMEKIEKKVQIYERTPSKQKQGDKFSRQLEQVNFVAAQIRSLLKEFVFIKAEADLNFEELLEIVAKETTLYQEEQILIREDIRRRELLSTQIIPELGVALLHTKTAGVMRPKFMICVPKDREKFSDSYFKGIKTVVVMLIPKDDHVRENSDILGFLSTSLVEEDEFLETIEDGEREDVLAFLTRLLKTYFNQYLEKV